LEAVIGRLFPPSPSAAEAENANDASVVMLVSLPAMQVLATGDIGKSAQERVLSTGILGRIDQRRPLILKISHHGSADQSERFHRALRPEISIISVGDNSYGHPDLDLISELRSLGSKVLRTDLDGMVGIQGSPSLKIFATGKL